MTDETPRLQDELVKSLVGMTVDERDRAAVWLALRYAWMIDTYPEMLEKLGSKLTTVLVELRLTPASRGTGGGAGGVRSPAGEALDELKAKRRQRAAR